jgi:hypothetical protein
MQTGEPDGGAGAGGRADDRGGGISYRLGTGRAAFVAMCLLVGLSGCDIFGPEVCHTGIFYGVEPGEMTLEIGESFTPVATIETCPEGERELSVEWIPADPEVVAVDGSRITGLLEGETMLEGRSGGAGTVVSVSVTVVQGKALGTR